MYRDYDREILSDNEALSACVGKTVASVTGLEDASENAEFLFTDGYTLQMFHCEDCCESVAITQVDGDADDLIGEPLVMCEVVGSDDAPAPEHAESFTWTFVKFGTTKGYVTVRWLGESNGYYGEMPAISLLKPSEEMGRQ